jgi:hypothetical protein
MLRRFPHPPKLRGLPLGLGCPLFALSDALTSLNPQASVPTGPTQTSRRDFSFCACLYEVWSAPLRPWIVASHHFTAAVTKGDGPVRVLGYHGSKQPTSNSEPTLRDGVGCFRNSHVGEAKSNGFLLRYNWRLYGRPCSTEHFAFFLRCKLTPRPRHTK